jgi:hydroxyquinol 1,2-dioxygenase
MARLGAESVEKGGQVTATDTTAVSDITAKALSSFDRCADDRLRTIMKSLVRHLHEFVTEVGLTESEWMAGIEFLTDVGHITDDKRQEFILLSDTLGVSMVVDAISHQLPPGATQSTVLGPFYVSDSPLREYGASTAEKPSGTPCWVHGRVLDTDGNPIAGAQLDVWQNADDQLYAVQDPSIPQDNLRGRFLTRDDGSYAFLAVRPTDYTVPSDGPVGKMLAAVSRHPWRPAHLHMIVSALGYRTLVTHIFDPASEHLDSDTVFAVKPSLVRNFVERKPDDPETPQGVDGPWVSVENDVVLAKA